MEGPPKTTGAQQVRHQLLDLLRRAGVQQLFGNPGSSEVPLLDALATEPRLEYRLVLHESIAIAMADAYAQLGRRLGVVSLHVTPGLANAIGGLFLARSHRSPILVLVGQQDSRLLLREPFLASDLVGLARQHAKWAWQPQRGEEVLPTLQRALQIALQPPAGPVVVAIPRDFLSEPAAGPTAEGGPVRAIGSGRPDPAAIGAVADAILGAHRPLILSGNRVGSAGARAVALMAEIAELTGAPVRSEHNATTMHFPGGHPNYLGGNAHGTASMRSWFPGRDLVLAVGCDLVMEDHFEAAPLIPPTVRLVQVNESVDEIGRIYPPAIAVVADIEAALTDLRSALQERTGPREQTQAARRQAATRRERRSIEQARERVRGGKWSAVPIHMTRVYAELRAAMPDDAIMVDEAVNMASYLHDFFEFRVADTLLSSKQSWLGWGLGAALGAKLARPDRAVVACVGDGSASYTIQALWTAARYRIPVLVVILRNGRYMAVEHHLREYGGVAAATGRFVGTDLGGIDFVRLARGYGVPARRVTDPADLGPAFRWALSRGRPTLVEVVIDPDDAGMNRPPILHTGA